MLSGKGHENKGIVGKGMNIKGMKIKGMKRKGMKIKKSEKGPLEKAFKIGVLCVKSMWDL